MAHFNTTPTPLLRLDGASVSWALTIIDRTDICHHLDTSISGPNLSTARKAKGKCCTNKVSVTIPNKEGMRYRQTGPAFKTPEWKKVYGTWRNVIETRNDYVKNNRGGAAIGDHTRRPVRGFAAAFFYTALGVVAANVSMIRRFLGRVDRDEKTPPPDSGKPVPPRDPAREKASPNAPPAREAA